MPNYRIADLPDAGALAGDDVLELQRGTGAGSSKRTTVAQLRVAGVNVQNADYTLTRTDEGKLLMRTSGSGEITWTLPTHTAVALQVGAMLTAANLAEDPVQLRGAPGTQLRLSGRPSSGNVSLAGGSVLTLTKASTDTWLAWA